LRSEMPALRRAAPKTPPKTIWASVSMLGIDALTSTEIAGEQTSMAEGGGPDRADFWHTSAESSSTPAKAHRRASADFSGMGRVETAGSGLNLSRAELALEGIGQLVVHERDAYMDRAAVVAGLIEIHRNAILMVEPDPHVLVSIGEFPGLDV
jgi:hypothetical protein